MHRIRDVDYGSALDHNWAGRQAGLLDSGGIPITLTDAEKAVALAKGSSDLAFLLGAAFISYWHAGFRSGDSSSGTKASPHFVFLFLIQVNVECPAAGWQLKYGCVVDLWSNVVPTLVSGTTRSLRLKPFPPYLNLVGRSFLTQVTKGG